MLKLRKGESSREKAILAILALAAEQKEHKKSDFVRELSGKFAKNTIYKYLKMAADERLLKMKPGRPEESFRPTYLITKWGLDKAQRVDLKDEIDEVNVKWLTPLRNLILRMKHETTYLEGFLNNNCITFIGDVPCTFDKSPEGMQSHIAFERSLRQRHQRDLERFREEFIRAHMKTDKIGRACVEARIKDEVGWTIGEYLKKLLKKAEKEKGVRKIMTVLGITEEMLAEMTKNSESERPKDIKNDRG